MIDPETVIKQMLEAWVTGQCAEIEVHLDLPEQTCSVVVRRQPLGATIEPAVTIDADTGLMERRRP
jgi:hypothetical protein